jgi:hypothetical protein
MDPGLTPVPPAFLLCAWLATGLTVREAPEEDLRLAGFALRDFAGVAACELRRPNFPLRAFN